MTASKETWKERDNVRLFKEEVIALCKEWGFSISHEDEHGAFIIKKYKKLYADWFIQAIDETGNQND